MTTFEQAGNRQPVLSTCAQSQDPPSRRGGQTGVDAATARRMTVWGSHHPGRDSSQIQLTSQLRPQSGENDCSMRAVVGVGCVHT